MPYVAGTPTVISQVAKATLGGGAVGHLLFLLVQTATMLILYTGANTPFNGFPFLASFVAEDSFLPRQLTKRGHRLAFSNGIAVLTVLSVVLLVGTGAHVDKLVAFYAIGVFTGFTLAGFGMARQVARRRGPRWPAGVAVNALAGALSLVVVLIFAVVKFTEGAWLVVVVFPLAVLGLLRLNRQYAAEARASATVRSGSPATAARKSRCCCRAGRTRRCSGVCCTTAPPTPSQRPSARCPGSPPPSSRSTSPGCVAGMAASGRPPVPGPHWCPGPVRTVPAWTWFRPTPARRRPAC